MQKKSGHAFMSVHKSNHRFIFWDVYLLQLKIIDNEDQSTLKTKSGEFMFLPAVTLGPAQRQRIQCLQPEVTRILPVLMWQLINYATR